MFKRILFTGALFAAGAASAQEVAISGKDFLSARATRRSRSLRARLQRRARRS
jgi:hypothetical protein